MVKITLKLIILTLYKSLYSKLIVHDIRLHAEKWVPYEGEKGREKVLVLNFYKPRGLF